MNRLLKYKDFIFERLNSARGKMQQLVTYFEKTIEEKEELLPEFFDNNYPQILENWTIENYEYFLELDEYESEEEAIDNIIYPTTHYELDYYPEAKEAYKEFLIKIVENVFNDNSYDLDLNVLPLYVTYTYEGDVEDDWLVHFTEYKENITSILKDKCFHGIPNMDNLAITGVVEEREEDGYCFAFTLFDVDTNFKNGYGHYGNQGILFKTSGIKLYHNGDNELQVVFIGNQVSNMIPFWYNEKTKEFYNKNKTIKSNDSTEFFEQLIS